VIGDGRENRCVLGVVEVRVEAVVNGLCRVGCSKLLRDADQTMVEIAMRDWPDDDSSQQIAVELVDPDTGEPWPRRDDGATSSPLHIGDGAYSGCDWFESRGTTDVRLRVRFGTKELIDTDVELVELPASDLGVKILDATTDTTEVPRDLAERIGSYQYGAAIADVVGAVSSSPSRIGQLVVTPVALEWWGEVSRLAVHLAGDVDTADLPRWWQLRIAGDPTTWAISEGFRSAPDGRIGHLLFL
jgi:hypothetical protein